jgi:beta-lactam-binding protein with PASTA domain
VGQTFIARQNPGPGLSRRDQVDRVELSATRYLLAMVTVPEARQLTVSAAVQRLRNAGLNVIIEIDGQRFTPAEYTAKALINILGGNNENQGQEPIISTQNPEPGTEVKKGTTVTIGVYQGYIPPSR